jgi:hypothetical protein
LGGAQGSGGRVTGGGNGGAQGGGGGAIDSGIADQASEPTVEAGCSNPTLCDLKAALVHRYTFNGAGMQVIDSIGTAHGTVVNTQLSGMGTLALAGGTSDQYVNLPKGMIHTLTSATFEVWVAWSGGNGWQRIFDFGDTTNDAGLRGTASTTFYLTPQAAIVASFPGPAVMLTGFKRADQMSNVEVHALSTIALPTGVMSHVAVVVDTTVHQISLYRNGALDGSVAFPDSFAVLNDVNCWLGRSQYQDPGFSGTLYEFRIYGVALAAASIAASYTAGPDTAFLN